MLVDAFQNHGDPRVIRELQGSDLMSLTQSLSKRLVDTPIFFRMCARLIRSLGFDLRHVVMDRPRFRCTPALGSDTFLDPFLYGAHRDTWFAEPEAQINIWISPYDVVEKQTFVFYPEYFSRAVLNSSVDFDLDYQIENECRAHPRPLEQLGGEIVRFSANEGDLIVFSSAQLHQTIRNSSGEHRYALQLRIVDLRDIEEISTTLRLDNSSRGSTLRVMRSVAAWLRSAEETLGTLSKVS